MAAKNPAAVFQIVDEGEEYFLPEQYLWASVLQRALVDATTPLKKCSVNKSQRNANRPMPYEREGARDWILCESPHIGGCLWALEQVGLLDIRPQLVAMIEQTGAQERALNKSMRFTCRRYYKSRIMIQEEFSFTCE